MNLWDGDGKYTYDYIDESYRLTMRYMLRKFGFDICDYFDMMMKLALLNNVECFMPYVYIYS